MGKLIIEQMANVLELLIEAISKLFDTLTEAVNLVLEQLGVSLYLEAKSWNMTVDEFLDFMETLSDDYD